MAVAAGGHWAAAALVAPERRTLRSWGRQLHQTLVPQSHWIPGRGQSRPKLPGTHSQQCEVGARRGRSGVAGARSTGDSVATGTPDWHCRCCQGWWRVCRGSGDAGGIGEGAGGGWDLRCLSCRPRNWRSGRVG